jgi:hypothetical protein
MWVVEAYQKEAIASAPTRGSFCVTRELIPSIRLCNGDTTAENLCSSLRLVVG